MIFDETDHTALARLFRPDALRSGWGPADGSTYPGYRPEVREAPNGDTKVCAACHRTGRVPVGGAAWGTVERDAECPTCHGSGRVPNVDAGRAGKRFLHVALKYKPPAWAEAYLARAHWEACKVAEALGVPAAYYPHAENGTLRVLEYPSAGHDCTPVVGGIHDGQEKCLYCGAYWGPYVGNVCGSDVCPVLAPGAGTVEHTDPNLFTVLCYRSHPGDLELSRRYDSSARHAAQALSPGLHIGELGEIAGLGPATPHRVPARPYAQRSIVYFASPAMAAELPHPVTFANPTVTVHTCGQWQLERIKRSRYTHK